MGETVQAVRVSLFILFYFLGWLSSSSLSTLLSFSSRHEISNFLGTLGSVRPFNESIHFFSFQYFHPPLPSLLSRMMDDLIYA